MNNEKKILSLLGLIMKSGNIVSGEDTVLGEIKKKNLSLVIVASDASENTKKKFRDKCSYRGVSMVEFSTKETLGSALGKGIRSVVGIKDSKISKKIKGLMEL